MNNIYPEVAAAVAPITGWCSAQKWSALVSAVLIMRPAVTVEIGVWAGKSCIPLALAHQHIGKGIVHAVDPWSPAASVEGQVNAADVEWWSHQGNHDYAKSEFEKAILVNNLSEVIKIHPVKSDDYNPPDGIGIWHCDANHGAQSIRDVNRYAPKIALGGLAFMDDLKWSGGAVQEATLRLLELGFRELYVIDDKETSNQWGVFQKVK